MSSNARNRRVFAAKAVAVLCLIAITTVAATAAFGPQSLSLERLLTPFIGAAAPIEQKAQTFKEVEPQLHAEPPAPVSMPSGALATARSGHTATVLADGRVLIVGGSGDTSAEIYDNGNVSATGNTNHARTGHTATRLSDGRVLIAGGGNVTSEIYDPANGTFSLGPNMTASRSGHTATAVGNSVIITGGGTDSVEVYDSTNNSFAAAGSLTGPRTNHSAAAMNDGRVFIAGGDGLDTAEIYNPADGTSLATGNPLAHQRSRAHLRVLPDGKVQIIGGNDDVSMEVYDPAIDTVGAHVHLLPDTDTCTGLRAGVRDSQTRAALFFAGNADGAYDRTGHTITEVSGNQALVIGGTTGGSASNSVTTFASSPATITTDKLDYAPGETVTFSGTGFAPGETVRVVIHEDPHTHLERNFEATADASGNISGSYLVEEHDLNVKFIVNARGLSSTLMAQTAFTDAGGFSITVSPNTVGPGTTNDFTFSYQATNGSNGGQVTLTVPAGWTTPQTGVGPGQIIVTDGTCNVTFVNIVGNVIQVNQPASGNGCANNLTFSITYKQATAPSPAASTVYSFDNNLGADPQITVSADTTAPTVTINQAAGQNDPANTSPINFTAVFSEPVNNFAGVDIDLGGTAGPTTAVVTGGPRIYNVAVTGMTSNGTVSASIAANRATDAAGNQNTASTSTDNIVTYDGTAPTILSITRTGAATTNASQVGWTITFSEPVTGVGLDDFAEVRTGITGAALSLLGPGSTTYSYTTGTGNGSGSIGLNLNDDDSIMDAAGNKLGGTGIGTAGSGGAGNGSLVGEVYTIDRTITAVIVANDKPYDGGVSAALASCSTTSALTITQDVQAVCSSPTFDDPNAGNRTVTANITLTGADASRYVLSSTTATDTAEITPTEADCTSIAGQSVTYDGNAHVGVGSCKDLGGNDIAGLTWGTGQTDVPGGLVSWSFTSSNPNYQNNVGGNVTVTINPAVANCSSVTGQSLTYDGNAHVGVGSCKDLGGNDIAGLNWGLGQTDVPGGLVSWSLTSANPNYQDNAGGNVTVTINPATATITVNGYSVQYDGLPHGLSGTATGVGGADLSSFLSFGPAVTDVPGGSITWSFDAGTNYNTANGSATVTITQAPSSTVVTCPVSVPYNSEEQEPCTVSVTGIGGLALSPNASYSNNINVGTATASYNYAGGLNHTGSNGSDTFDITAIALTIDGAVAQNKAYDGETDADVDFSGASLVTPINGDDVTIDSTNYSATFDTADVGEDKPVTVSGVVLAGADKDNYTLSQPAGLTADITKKLITLVGAVAQDKDYDGTLDAEVNFGAATLDGVEAGDSVGYDPDNYVASFATKDVGTDIIVSVTDVFLTDPDSANYELELPIILAADINKRLVTVTITPQTKVYDGTTDAVLDPTDFVVGNSVSGEGFTVNQTVGAYNDANVAGASSVSASLAPANFDPANVATLPSNYDYPPTASGDGSITKAATTTTVTCADGTYTGSAVETCQYTVTGPSLSIGPAALPSGNYSNNVNAGVDTASGSFTYAESANHLGSDDSDTFSIAKAATTTTVTCADGTYTGSAVETCTYTVTGPNLSIGPELVPSGNYANNVNAGIDTASASFTYAESDNHLSSSDSDTFSIAKADADCTITGYSGAYDGAAHGATGECRGVMEELLAGLDLGTQFTNVPGGTANWTFTDVTGNYNDDSGTAEIEITPVLVTITASSPADILYGSATPTVTASYSGFVVPENESVLTTDPTCSTAYVPGNPVGPYTTSCSGAAATNYTISYVNGGFDVLPVTLNVNAVANTKVYGDPDPAFGFTLSGFVLSENPTTAGVTGTANCSRTAGEAVLGSPYTITCSPGAPGNLAATNYVFATGTTVNFNITPKALVASVTANNKVFDGNNTATLTGCTFTNLVGSDVVNCSISGATATFASHLVGTHTVTATGLGYSGPAASNYSFDGIGTGTASIGAWTLNGYYAPVGIPNTYNVLVPPTIKWNTVKGGQTVPLKFNVFAGAVEQTSTSAIMYFTAQDFPCNAVPTETEDTVEITTTGGTILRYSGTPGVDGQFIQNWQTPKAPDKCYRVTMTTLDGSRLVAFFKTKK